MVSGSAGLYPGWEVGNRDWFSGWACPKVGKRLSRTITIEKSLQAMTSHHPLFLVMGHTQGLMMFFLRKVRLDPARAPTKSWESRKPSAIPVLEGMWFVTQAALWCDPGVRTPSLEGVWNVQ